MPLTRADIVQIIRGKLSLSGKDAGRVLETFVDCIAEAMAKGLTVSVPGLGRFGVRDTPPRPGRNPKTGVFAQVPGRRKPHFSMSRTIRERIHRNFVGSPEPEPGPPAPPDGDSL